MTIIDLILILNLLIIEPDLNQRAEIRATQVVDNWSHDNWKQSFVGTDCSYQGENLAKNFTDTEMFIAFLLSKTHRDNILNQNYKRIGVGRYENVTAVLFCG